MSSGVFRDVRDVVFPKFDKEFTEACVIEFEALLFALLREEHRSSLQTQSTFSEETGPPLMEEDCFVFLCRSLYQPIAEEKWSGMHRIADLGKLAWRRSDKEPFFSPKTDLQVSFNKRSELREALWNVDNHKAMKVCEERHTTVEGSESTHISFDRVDDPWLS